MNVLNLCISEDRAQDYIVGSLIYHEKEEYLKGDVTAPGGFKHLCDDSTLGPAQKRRTFSSFFGFTRTAITVSLILFKLFY